MASQSEPVTTTDVVNYTGETLYLGAKFGKSPLISMAGLSRGYRQITGNQYAMSNQITGDTPSQSNLRSEDESITTITATSYTAAQETNYAEIHEWQYVVSYASQALNGVISGVANISDKKAVIAGFPTQRIAHMKQLMGDLEFSALRGTAQAWTNAGTTGATGGLVTQLESNSSYNTDAGGASLSTSLINTEIARMAASHAEFNDIVIAANAHQYQALSDLYGNPPLSRTVGGVELAQIMLPVAGRCSIVYDPALATDDVVFVDMEYFRPCFGITPGMPPIFTQSLAQQGAGWREMLYCIFGIDYFTYTLHGLIQGLATS